MKTAIRPAASAETLIPVLRAPPVAVAGALVLADAALPLELAEADSLLPLAVAVDEAEDSLPVVAEALPVAETVEVDRVLLVSEVLVADEDPVVAEELALLVTEEDADELALELLPSPVMTSMLS